MYEHDMILHSSPIASLDDVTVQYGRFTALSHVSLAVEPRSISTWIGANGSGKSTALRALFQLLPEFGGRITSGTVTYRSKEINSVRPDLLAKRGLVLVPEGRRTFASMSVKENLEMARRAQGRWRTGALFGMQEVLDLFPHLKTRVNHQAGLLSTGEQQMLAFARALLLQPVVLALDEPTLGLSPKHIDAVLNAVIHLKSNGVTVVLVEQRASVALEMSDYADLFSGGKLIKSGTAGEFMTDMAIRDAYLGQRI